MMEDKQTFLCFVGTYCILMAMKESNCHVGLKTGEKRDGFSSVETVKRKTPYKRKPKAATVKAVVEKVQPPKVFQRTPAAPSFGFQTFAVEEETNFAICQKFVPNLQLKSLQLLILLNSLFSISLTPRSHIRFAPFRLRSLAAGCLLDQSRFSVTSSHPPAQNDGP